MYIYLFMLYQLVRHKEKLFSFLFQFPFSYSFIAFVLAFKNLEISIFVSLSKKASFFVVAPIYVLVHSHLIRFSKSNQMFTRSSSSYSILYFSNFPFPLFLDFLFSYSSFCFIFLRMLFLLELFLKTFYWNLCYFIYSFLFLYKVFL